MGEVRVRERGGARVDGILRATRLATQDRPLPAVLQDLSSLLSQVLDADIVSLYLREDGPGQSVLTMRANVGFPAGAVGNVRLRVGEGITGFAAETMRVIATERASASTQFFRVPGLDEERYPIFLAVPLVTRDRVAGVLVAQRSEGQAFDDAEVELAAALGGAFLLAIERAESRRRATLLETSDAGRAVRLDAFPLVGGLAHGRAPPLPALASFADRIVRDDVLGALDAVAAELRETLLRSLDRLDGDQRTAATALDLLPLDARFREALAAHCGTLGVVDGLSEVARSYALTPYRLGGRVEGEQWLADRANEVAGVCLLIAAELAGEGVVKGGDVLSCAEPPSAIVTLQAIARGAAGVVVGDVLSPGSLAGALLLYSEIPTVTEVASVFEWTRPGDTVFLDGDVGALWVHPGPSQLARVQASV